MALIPKLDVNEVTDVVVDLCQTARVQGGPLSGELVQFDVEFANDLTPAYKLAIAVGQHNFKKYFERLQAVGNDQAQAATAQDNKPL